MDLCRYFPSLAGPFGSLVFLEGRILGGDHSKGSAGYRDTHPISFGCPSLSLMKQLPGPTVGWTTTFVPSTHCPGAMPPAPVRWDVLKCCGLVPGTPWLNSPWGVTFHLQKKNSPFIFFLRTSQSLLTEVGRINSSGQEFYRFSEKFHANSAHDGRPQPRWAGWAEPPSSCPPTHSHPRCLSFSVKFSFQ